MKKNTIESALASVTAAAKACYGAALTLSKAIALAKAMGATAKQVRDAMVKGGYKKGNLVRDLTKWYGDCPEIRERAKRSDSGEVRKPAEVKKYLAGLNESAVSELRELLKDGKPSKPQPRTVEAIAKAVVAYAEQEEIKPDKIGAILADVADMVTSILEAAE